MEVRAQTQSFTDGRSTAQILLGLSAHVSNLKEIIKKDFSEASVLDIRLAQLGSELKQISTPLKQWSTLLQQDLAVFDKEIQAQTAAGPKAQLTARLTDFKARTIPLEAEYIQISKQVDELSATYNNLKKLISGIKQNTGIDATLMQRTKDIEELKSGLKSLAAETKEIMPKQYAQANSYKELHTDLVSALPKIAQLSTESPAVTNQISPE